MKKFGLIGNNISYSLSPQIHGVIYRELNVDASYELINIPPNCVSDFADRLYSLDGFNVTQPHKTAITKLLAENNSPIDAVNTVKVRGGKMYGYNTDIFGFSRDVEKKFGSVAGKCALIIGAGGMAEAAAYALKNAGAHVMIKNRTVEKAVALCKKSGAELFDNNAKPEIIVNCSSAELFGGRTDLDGIDLSCLKCAYDTIYKKTQFIESAERAGAKTSDGLDMLIYQAIKAALIFTDSDIGDNAIENLKDIIRSEIRI